MKLLADEDSKAKILMARLASAGHDVVSTQTIGIDSVSDSEVFEIARELGRVILTRNPADYKTEHEQNKKPGHPGVLAIYEEAEVQKNMSYKDIVQAIDNIQKAGIDMTDAFVPLNAWRSPASHNRNTFG